MITDSLGRVGVIIKFKGMPYATSMRVKEELVKGFRGTTIFAHDFINAVTAFVCKDTIPYMQQDPNIEYVELDQVAYALAQSVPWGMTKINAPAVWNTGNKGAGIKVGIVDTGIDYNHPDLKTNYKGGYNYVNNTPDPWDGNGHGTHVAGIIAAIDNDIGVIGVAPEAWIYAVRVLNDSGSGSYSQVISGIEWCVNNGMQIISMSLGGSGFSQALKDACDAAFNAGLLLIAAAGNSGGSGCPTTGGNVGYPAKFDSVVAVASTDSGDALSSFSSRGPEVYVSAPGSGILSTVPTGSCTHCDPNGYKQLSGTSMACPHTSGAAALIWKQNPSMTNVQVKECLGSTAVDLGTPGRDSCFGRGRINAQAAVSCSGAPPPPPTKYKCTGSPDYQCVTDPNGPYNSLAECQAACQVTPPPPTGCPTAPKNVGDISILSGKGATGTAPFTIIFSRNDVEITRFTGVPLGEVKTYQHTHTSADVPSVKLSVDTLDSCSTPQTCHKECIIDVLPPLECPPITCSFTITGPSAGKKYRCTGAPSFQCLEDPNGPYNSLAECQAACVSGGCPALTSAINCPSQVRQNMAGVITLYANGGKSPFTYETFMDGVLIDSKTWIAGMWAFIHTFSESLGSHECMVKVTDGCSPPQTSTSACTIIIT